MAQRASHVRHCSKDNGARGMNRDQLKRLKELEVENHRLRRAVSDLTLDKLILNNAMGKTSQALRAAVSALIMCGRPLAYLSAGSAAHAGSIVLLKPQGALRLARRRAAQGGCSRNSSRAAHLLR